MTPYAEFDEAEFPIVKVRLLGDPTDEGFQAYLDHLTQVLRDGHKHGLLLDTGEQANFPAKYRALQAEWIAEREAELGGTWSAAAFVVRRRVFRGVLAVLFWLNPPDFPYLVTDEPENGLRFLRKQLGLAASRPPSSQPFDRASL